MKRLTDCGADKKRTKRLAAMIAGAGLILFAAVTVWWLFRAVPVVRARDLETTQIPGIVFQINGESIDFDPSQYDERAILTYLGTCQKHRILSGASGYQEGSGTIVICLQTEASIDYVVLADSGANSRSGGGAGPLFRIQNGPAVFSAVRQFLPLD